ncbi:peroxiredoxin [Lawsonella clevelandensis]|uniref:Alkyl hydroperoxide reductase n=1 Tax=Lawsonella clevelandensis TaxID=1528099 RepID=A0A0M4MYM6_9ACTN|nr:peroxiredoxin [Lawsonella clevelandensis]ALE19543.1 alkyl hydroperoxide reductase [Lawsonella clevelandensis]ALE34154.1 alkyl hydroperoxide reductase [Lawsonella clevelandensis]MDU7193916.1 peroxiredoxin [Lawsonella clevelandensis]VHN99713.1 Alkyl hydroperoxide reductase subunit C [Lawsonella clevelandensis]
MALLTIDDEFPEFSLTALKGGNLHDIDADNPEDYFETIDNNSYNDKWRVIFFYPKDFTFVCPTEIKAFGDLNDEFFDRDCQVLGVSIDSEYSHFQWRATNDKLLEIPFPMLADIKHELVQATGVENADGVADRVTFIVNPENKIQYVSATPDSVGRSVEEVLRVLDALQTAGPCGCDWKKNDPTINKLDVVSSVFK